MDPFEQILKVHPWLVHFKEDLQPHCPDCRVGIGRKHRKHCDIARCSVCQLQLLACACKKGQPDLWIGLMYPVEHKICLDKGFWCYDAILVDGDEYPVTSAEMRNLGLRLRDHGFPVRFHIPCTKDYPGAHADLNRAMLHVQK